MKINFTPIERLYSYVEQTYCNAFGLKSRMHWLAQTFCITCQALLGEHGRWLQPLIPVTSAKLARRLHIFLFVLFHCLATSLHLGNHGIYCWMILKVGFVPDMPLVAVVAFVSCHLSGIIWVINLPLGYSLLCRFFVFVPHLLFED